MAPRLRGLSNRTPCTGRRVRAPDCRRTAGIVPRVRAGGDGPTRTSHGGGCLTQGLPANPGHPGTQDPRDARRQRRPHGIEPDRLPRLRRSACRRERRAPHQLRRSRVRHGSDHERAGAARRLHSVRRHLPDLQRLQPQRHPHGRVDEAARDPRLHARQHRPRRGRPHAPGCGACGELAPDSQSRRLAPRRRSRDGRRVDPGAHSGRAPLGPAPVAPEPAGTAALARAASRSAPRRLRVERPREPARRHSGHRFRAGLGHGGAASARRARAGGACGLAALVHRV
mmetsp:Transcript_38689/g.90431  ORF Transcript_38689/g.90431 Transcript_38689/m.90431 type:complete len:284 (-) Transcript_38689:1991-2842(-)